MLGMLAALGAGRMVESLLIRVVPTDPVTFVGATFAVVAIAALACYLPARRAARLDPLITLRSE